MDRLTNINSILAFVTVAREGSVSRAADALNLTQPAISHQIKRLSDEVGLKLFDRQPNGLTLTHDGERLLPKAQRVLEALDAFHANAATRRTRVRGKLRVGTIVDPEFIRLGALLGALCAAHPDIETELSHGVSGETLLRLNRNQIDAGFYLSAPDDLSDLAPPIHAITLADFEYLVIGPAGWQDRVTQATWPELAQLPWIGTPEVSVHNRLLSRIFADQNCTPNIAARVDQEASMLEMVRSGVGLSLSRDSVALLQRQSYGLAVCTTVSVPARLSLITTDQKAQTPTVAALLSSLETVWST
jgi:DNA-binding transcriptional LysR family regulator